MKYLYHITFYNRLNSILNYGLRPNQQRSIGGPSFDRYVQGKVFLTELEGVYFWMCRAEAFAEYNSDDLFIDMFVPVVLRVPTKYNTFNSDPIGARDASANAYTTEEVINSDRIDVFDGEEWIPIDEWMTIDIKQALDPEKDGDGTIIYDFKSHSPFLPPGAVD